MRRNWLEWVALLASGTTIGIVVVLLVVHGLTADGPADLSAELEGQGHPTSMGWAIPVRLTNLGGHAAENAVVEVTGSVEGVQETSELTVDFVSPGSTVSLEFVLSGRPAEPPQIRLLGYQLP